MNQYKGKDIETMTREELIDALIQMGNLYTRSIKQHMDDLDSLKLPTKK